MHGVAEEPGKNGTTATAQPETTGVIGPTGSGEEVGRGDVHSGVSGWNMRLFPWLVVQQEQQAEDVNRTDGSKQARCLLVFGGAQRTTDGEGSVEEIAEGGSGFETTEIRRNSRSVKRQIADQGLHEIAAVDRRGEIADAGVRNGSDSHWKRGLRGWTFRKPRSLGGGYDASGEHDEYSGENDPRDRHEDCREPGSSEITSHVVAKSFLITVRSTAQTASNSP